MRISDWSSYVCSSDLAGKRGWCITLLDTGKTGTKPMRALGLMSGTSLDGIDAAIIETDGESSVTPGPSLAIPYTPDERAVLRAALEDAKTWSADAPR